jgi:hypothetical protein
MISLRGSGGISLLYAKQNLSQDRVRSISTVLQETSAIALTQVSHFTIADYEPPPLSQNEKPRSAAARI